MAGDKNVIKQISIAESQKFVSQCHWSTVPQTLLSLFPILTWLPKYKWREDGVSDLVAGLTVAIMHIPQAGAHKIKNKNLKSSIILKRYTHIHSLIMFLLGYGLCHVSRSRTCHR